MKKLWRILPVFLMVLAIGTFSKAVQTRSGSESGIVQSQKELSVQGELLKVDTSTMTFTIKLKDGEETSFQYDTNTKVEGSQSGIQGLSQQSGTKVTVHYQEKSGKKVATRIEIIKADG